jgi:hypothetical protein
MAVQIRPGPSSHAQCCHLCTITLVLHTSMRLSLPREGRRDATSFPLTVVLFLYCVMLGKMTAVGFEPTPFRTSALSWRLRPLGHAVAALLDPYADPISKNDFRKPSHIRAHPGSNQGPADLQSAALPLSYIPSYHTLSASHSVAR